MKQAQGLQSRREYSIIIIAISTRHMYDDYDLEYSYTPEYTYDLDETYDMLLQSYNALDEDVQQEDDYARDNDTYEALAYRHYA